MDLTIISLSRFDLQYKHSVSLLADSKSPLTFNNSGPSHASIVISTIFKHTKSRIRIYAKNLDGTISNIGDYQEELNQMLQRRVSIQVIVDEIPKPHSNAFKILHANNASVEIKFSSDELKKNLAFHYNPDTHFIVADDLMFRLEYDNYRHQALCGFNDTKRSQQLIDIFDSHFEDCKTIISKSTAAVF